MSKRAEEAACKYAGLQNPPTDDSGVLTATDYYTFLDGYEQAEKDTIAKIRKQVEKWIPDNPEGDEYTSGERVAFRSVLHLLKEMEEEL